MHKINLLLFFSLLLLCKFFCLSPPPPLETHKVQQSSVRILPRLMMMMRSVESEVWCSAVLEWCAMCLVCSQLATLSVTVFAVSFTLWQKQMFSFRKTRDFLCCTANFLLYHLNSFYIALAFFARSRMFFMWFIKSALLFDAAQEQRKRVMRLLLSLSFNLHIN